MSEDKKDENVVSPPEGEDNTDNFDNQPKVDDKALDQSDKTDISKQNRHIHFMLISKIHMNYAFLLQMLC